MANCVERNKLTGLGIGTSNASGLWSYDGKGIIAAVVAPRYVAAVDSARDRLSPDSPQRGVARMSFEALEHHELTTG